MVGGIRSALIAVGLAACGPAAAPVSPQAAAPRTPLADVDWPIVEVVPDVPGAVDLYEPSATLVMAQFGPPRGATLTSDAKARLEKQLPKLKGSPRLAALDALAETADINSDVAFDGDAMVAKLETTSAMYTALIAEPGFATYAKADAVLFRAARIRFEINDYDAGATLVARMLSEYPRSAWISDVYVLIGNADADREPTGARQFYDDAIAIAAPSVRDYARYQRLHVLDMLGEYRAALADAELLAASNEGLRDPVALAVVHAFAEVGDARDAPAVFGKLDRALLPMLLHHVATAYRAIGKLDAATTVLADLLATSTDPLELCVAHTRMLDILETIGNRTEIVREARVLADLARHTTEPRCRLSIDVALGNEASDRTYVVDDIDELRDGDVLWQLAISVASTPERKAAELRVHAYLVWRLAQQLHDRDGWVAAATAFEAAFAATHDPRLDAGAALARSNARALTRR